MFLGQRPGGVDGLFGNNTRKALQAFHRAEAIQKTTELSDDAFDRLVRKTCDGNLDD